MNEYDFLFDLIKTGFHAKKKDVEKDELVKIENLCLSELQKLDPCFDPTLSVNMFTEAQSHKVKTKYLCCLVKIIVELICRFRNFVLC